MKRLAALKPSLLMVLLATLFAGLIAIVLWLSRAYEQQALQTAQEQQTRQAVQALRTHLSETEMGLQLAAQRGSWLENREGFVDTAKQFIAADAAIVRMELRHGNGSLIQAVDAGPPRPALPPEARLRQNFETSVALRSAIEFDRPVYSRPYYVQLSPDGGFELIELLVPLRNDPGENEKSQAAALAVVFPMPRLLATQLPANFLSRYEISATEADGTLIARAGAAVRGESFVTSAAPLDLPGASLIIRARSAQQALAWVPSVLTASLVLLALALIICVQLLWRHLRLRLATEVALREQHAFRKAMEDSLVTGLRARDLRGTTTYVNPAFCAMTGYTENELLGRSPPMPYWIAERIDEHERRTAQILAGQVTREGYESEFQRKNGERFNVLIFEAPLIDGSGQHTGWMSSVVDVSETRRIEAINRKQFEQLQTNTRLSMLGEMATAMSHELNQPLGAITSYAAACENLLAQQQLGPLQGALSAIRQQSERAGQVIRSVQAFVKHREVERMSVELDRMIERLLPLIQLQVRRVQARLELDLQPVTILGDETLLEQVLLNLTRNAIDAMQAVDPARRVLRIELREIVSAIDSTSGAAELSVLDQGQGISAEHEAKLFSPFFSTKAAGLGVGLSFCRSVMERLGGQIAYASRSGGGSCFVMTFPLTKPAPLAATRTNLSQPQHESIGFPD